MEKGPCLRNHITTNMQIQFYTVHRLQICQNYSEYGTHLHESSRSRNESSTFIMYFRLYTAWLSTIVSTTRWRHLRVIRGQQAVRPTSGRRAWHSRTLLQTQRRQTVSPSLHQRHHMASLLTCLSTCHQGTRGPCPSQCKRSDDITLGPWRDGRSIT
jgi:hypothetical protein